MTEYVHVGSHPDRLASGAYISPGERMSPDDLHDEDQHIVDEGRLVEVDSFDDADNKQTRQELRKRAADLGLEGWSSMKVAELRTAITEREAQEGLANAS